MHHLQAMAVGFRCGRRWPNERKDDSKPTDRFEEKTEESAMCDTDGGLKGSVTEEAETRGQEGEWLGCARTRTAS